MPISKEQRAAYQKAYRAKKKAEQLPVVELTDDEIRAEVAAYREVKLAEVSFVEDTQANRDAGASYIVGEAGQERFELPITVVPDIEDDRSRGLPRSNYYSDHAAKGGWTETIRNIDPKLQQRILDRIAPPRRTR